MKKLSLSSKILIGVLLGSFVGLFFGERVAWFSIAGDAFIGLLQMTVLPYIMFTLIVNIGRLSMDKGKKIIKYGLLFLLLLLSLGLVGLFILPFAFPNWESGQFYTDEFILSSPPFDFVKQYIPANPFRALSDNIVPAVVLFSIFLGLGVMKIPGKEALLTPLDKLTEALNQVNKMVVKITPLGVFCIAAGVVSTISLTELSKLQGFLWIYLLAVLIFTFLVLPYLISIFTPYSPKTVFRITRSTLITIFATGKIIVVYPQLIENIKEIIRSEEHHSEEAENEVDIVMPLAYPFPNLGAFLIFIFIPFASWYIGKELVFSDYPAFLSSTFLSSFVAPITGLPYSLELMDIPKDTFQLFVVSTVITDRLRVVLGAFHLITLTLLTITASQGYLQFKKGKLIQGIILITLSVLISIIGLNKYLDNSMKGIPSNEEIVNNFEIISPLQEYVVLSESKKNPNRKYRGENTLSRIKRTGELRVGFYKNSMPFTFWNKDTSLVGYGIDLAHRLANDLHASIVFVPIEDGRLEEDLNSDHYDIVMSDIFLSSYYAEKLQLSKTYMDVTLALLVKKNENRFKDFQSSIELDTFTIAYFQRKEIAEEFLSYFPKGGAHSIEHLNDYFDAEEVDSIKMDAYLTSAERASALTVIHNEYKVVNPLPYHISIGLVFPLADDEAWGKFIDKWIDYRQKDGTLDRIYSQWILGKEFKKKEVRWNIYDEYFSKNEVANEFPITN